MQMRPFFILVLAVFIGISSNAQTVSPRDLPEYDYDTTLKGGYTISFKADDSLEYLYLKKGDKVITELSSMGIGLLYKNLGYVGADFTDYFVLVHSFGSGNPHYIELIKKATGENILKNGEDLFDEPAWIDADEKKEYLLYSEKDVPSKNNKMTLLNIRTGRKQYFSFPSDIFGEPQVLNRIWIDKLTDKQLIIKYYKANSLHEKTIIYNR